jgi:hypothetical protein
MFWHWLSNSLAMSPLAHCARPHRFPTRYEAQRHPLGISNHLTSQPTLLVRAAKDIVVFRSGPLRSAPLQNPKDFGFAFGDYTSLRCHRCEPSFLAVTSQVLPGASRASGWPLKDSNFQMVLVAAACMKGTITERR